MFRYHRPAFPFRFRPLPAVFLLLGLARAATAADATAVFNEVMYHPAPGGGAEWVELKNVLSVNLDISGWRISGGVNYTFPEGTVINAGGFLVVSGAPEAPATVPGSWTGNLANEGETVTLRDRNDGVMDELSYADSGEWPPGADGSGASLAKRRADSASASPGSWLASAQTGGTPGAENFAAAPPSPAVVLNELAPAGADFFVELRNPGLSPAALGGMILASSEGGVAHTLPVESLAPGGLRVISAAALGFSPSESAKLFLFAPNRAALLDAQSLRSTARARSADGTEWFTPSALTPGTANVFALRNEVIFSEINYHPRREPARAGVYANHSLTKSGDSWRYDAGGVDPGPNWRQPAFNDSAWTVGAAPFRSPARAAYVDLIQAATPVGFWRLGENPTTGTAVDSAPGGGSQNGVYTGATSQPGLIVGDSNRAAVFNGSTQVNGAGLSGVFNNDWSIEAWFVHTSQTEWAGVFSNNGVNGESAAPLMTFVENSTRLGINGAGVSPDNVSVELGPDHYNKRVYAVITKTGGNAPGTAAITVRAWVDGVEVPPATGTTTWTLSPRSSWIIGKHWAGGGPYNFHGTIDEVAVYNRVLSPAEIAGHEEAGRVAAGPPLPQGVTTTYFRRSFDFAGDPAHTALALETLVDDGAVVYLNGAEIARRNMPAGEISHGTLASTSVDSAVSGGAVAFPSTGLVRGNNVLAVELHQAAAAADPDSAFALSLSARETLVEPAPAGEPDTEFVELHNRSDAEVDLSGWSLAGETDYLFPAGTLLGAGEYLAVARNPDELLARHPGIRVTGPLDGGLSNSGGRVILRDPAGNRSDTVAYLDGRPWPKAADGGGSTLERLDPSADSHSPHAWAASDEFSRTAWETHTYRGVAAPSAVGPDSQWREFVIGLLDDGELLLDDIHVVEDPDGVRVELLQNSDFSAGAVGWRMLGNHAGTVIPEPGAPGNQVLRLAAGGATDHDSDHLETTLGNGLGVVNGRTYEISFRARWLSGCQALNTRLYFNRLGRTTVLAAPAPSGTPGAANSLAFRNTGPAVSALRHAPAVPAAGAPVTLTVKAADPDGVAKVRARYSVNGGTWQSALMTLAQGSYIAILPGQPASAIIQYYVEATDGQGTVSTWPAAGPASRALYKVQDGQANLTSLHSLRIIMTAADAEWMHANVNLMSGKELGATVISDENEIFHDAGIHLRGSRYGRTYDEFVSYSVSFPADQPLRGVHRRLVIDRSGRAQFGSPSPDEILVKHMAGHAGNGLGDLRNDIIRVIAPLPKHTSVALLSTDYSNDWLDRHFENGSDSPLYKMDGVYYANRTTDGNPESPKIVEAGPIAWADFADRGPNPESYRWNFVAENPDVQPGAERLIALNAAFSLTGAALETASNAVMDVDQWARTFALQSLVGNIDFYTHVAQPHNLKIYLRPDDNRFVAFQHDSDNWFQMPANAPLIGTTGNVIKIFNLPANKRLFHGHLLDLINTTYNTDYMAPWVAHYGAKAGKDYSPLLNHITARKTYVLGQLPASVPFAITTNGGADFTLNATRVTIEGSGWINVRGIQRSDTGAMLEPEWTGANTWRVDLALAHGENAITLEAFDFQGASIGGDSITIHSTATVPLPRDFLRVTEVHYHPAVPAGAERSVSTDKNDFEFVELRNIGTESLDISGCALSSGVDFTLPPDTVLAAGECLVVVANEEAFRARYGPGARIAGAYGPADSLNNSGETLTLTDATGVEIQAFTWDDAWFPVTDGGGRSLVARDEHAGSGSWDMAAQWGISTSAGGTPGVANSGAVAWQFEGWRQSFFTPSALADPLVSGADAGEGGLSNQLRYALGMDASGPLPPPLSAALIDGALTAVYQRRKDLLDVRFTVEASPDLAEWMPLTAPAIQVTANGGGTETVSVRDTDPPGNTPRRYLRLRVALVDPVP